MFRHNYPDRPQPRGPPANQNMNNDVMDSSFDSQEMDRSFGNPDGHYNDQSRGREIIVQPADSLSYPPPQDNTDDYPSSSRITYGSRSTTDLPEKVYDCPGLVRVVQDMLGCGLVELKGDNGQTANCLFFRQDVFVPFRREMLSIETPTNVQFRVNAWLINRDWNVPYLAASVWSETGPDIPPPMMAKIFKSPDNFTVERYNAFANHSGWRISQSLKEDNQRRQVVLVGGEEQVNRQRKVLLIDEGPDIIEVDNKSTNRDYDDHDFVKKNPSDKCPPIIDYDKSSMNSQYSSRESGDRSRIKSGERGENRSRSRDRVRYRGNRSRSRNGRRRSSSRNRTKRKRSREGRHRRSRSRDKRRISTSRERSDRPRSKERRDRRSQSRDKRIRSTSKDRSRERRLSLLSSLRSTSRERIPILPTSVIDPSQQIGSTSRSTGSSREGRKRSLSKEMIREENRRKPELKPKPRKFFGTIKSYIDDECGLVRISSCNSAYFHIDQVWVTSPHIGLHLFREIYPTKELKSHFPVGEKVRCLIRNVDLVDLCANGQVSVLATVKDFSEWESGNYEDYNIDQSLDYNLANLKYKETKKSCLLVNPFLPNVHSVEAKVHEFVGHDIGLLKLTGGDGGVVLFHKRQLLVLQDQLWTDIKFGNMQDLLSIGETVGVVVSWLPHHTYSQLQYQAAVVYKTSCVNSTLIVRDLVTRFSDSQKSIDLKMTLDKQFDLFKKVSRLDTRSDNKHFIPVHALLNGLPDNWQAQVVASVSSEFGIIRVFHRQNHPLNLCPNVPVIHILFHIVDVYDVRGCNARKSRLCMESLIDCYVDLTAQSICTSREVGQFFQTMRMLTDTNPMYVGIPLLQAIFVCVKRGPDVLPCSDNIPKPTILRQEPGCFDSQVSAFYLNPSLGQKLQLKVQHFLALNNKPNLPYEDFICNIPRKQFRKVPVNEISQVYEQNFNPKGDPQNILDLHVDQHHLPSSSSNNMDRRSCKDENSKIIGVPNNGEITAEHKESKNITASGTMKPTDKIVKVEVEENLKNANLTREKVEQQVEEEDIRTSFDCFGRVVKFLNSNYAIAVCKSKTGSFVQVLFDIFDVWVGGKVVASIDKKLPDVMVLGDYLRVNCIFVEQSENLPKRVVEYMATAVCVAKTFKEASLLEFPAGAEFVNTLDRIDKGKLDNFKAVVKVLGSVAPAKNEYDLSDELKKELQKKSTEHLEDQVNSKVVVNDKLSKVVEHSNKKEEPVCNKSISNYDNKPLQNKEELIQLIIKEPPEKKEKQNSSINTVPQQKENHQIKPINEEAQQQKEEQVQLINKEPSQKKENHIKLINKEPSQKKEGQVKSIKKVPLEIKEQINSITKEPPTKNEEKRKSIDKEPPVKNEENIKLINKETLQNEQDRSKSHNIEPQKKREQQIKPIDKEPLQQKEQTQFINKETSQKKEEQVKSLKKLPLQIQEEQINSITKEPPQKKEEQRKSIDKEPSVKKKEKIKLINKETPQRKEEESKSHKIETQTMKEQQIKPIDKEPPVLKEERIKLINKEPSKNKEECILISNSRPQKKEEQNKPMNKISIQKKQEQIHSINEETTQKNEEQETSIDKDPAQMRKEQNKCMNKDISEMKEALIKLDNEVPPQKKEELKKAINKEPTLKKEQIKPNKEPIEKEKQIKSLNQIPSPEKEQFILTLEKKEEQTKSNSREPPQNNEHLKSNNKSPRREKEQIKSVRKEPSENKEEHEKSINEEPLKNKDEQIKSMSKEPLQMKKDQNKLIIKDPPHKKEEWIKSIIEEPLQKKEEQIKLIIKEPQQKKEEQLRPIYNKSLGKKEEYMKPINKEPLQKKEERAKSIQEQIKSVRKEPPENKEEHEKSINEEPLKNKDEQIKSIRKEPLQMKKDQNMSIIKDPPHKKEEWIKSIIEEPLQNKEEQIKLIIKEPQQKKEEQLRPIDNKSLGKKEEQMNPINKEPLQKKEDRAKSIQEKTHDVIKSLNDIEMEEDWETQVPRDYISESEAEADSWKEVNKNELKYSKKSNEKIKASSLVGEKQAHGSKSPKSRGLREVFELKPENNKPSPKKKKRQINSVYNEPPLFSIDTNIVEKSQASREELETLTALHLKKSAQIIKINNDESQNPNQPTKLPKEKKKIEENKKERGETQYSKKRSQTEVLKLKSTEQIPMLQKKSEQINLAKKDELNNTESGKHKKVDQDFVLRKEISESKLSLRKDVLEVKLGKNLDGRHCWLGKSTSEMPQKQILLDVSFVVKQISCEAFEEGNVLNCVMEDFTVIDLKGICYNVAYSIIVDRQKIVLEPDESSFDVKYNKYQNILEKLYTGQFTELDGTNNTDTSGDEDLLELQIMDITSLADSIVWNKSKSDGDFSVKENSAFDAKSQFSFDDLLVIKEESIEVIDAPQDRRTRLDSIDSTLEHLEMAATLDVAVEQLQMAALAFEEKDHLIDED